MGNEGIENFNIQFMRPKRSIDRLHTPNLTSSFGSNNVAVNNKYNAYRSGNNMRTGIRFSLMSTTLARDPYMVRKFVLLLFTVLKTNTNFEWESKKKIFKVLTIPFYYILTTFLAICGYHANRNVRL